MRTAPSRFACSGYGDLRILPLRGARCADLRLPPLLAHPADPGVRRPRQEHPGAQGKDAGDGPGEELEEPPGRARPAERGDHPDEQRVGAWPSCLHQRVRASCPGADMHPRLRTCSTRTWIHMASSAPYTTGGSTQLLDLLSLWLPH